MDKQRLPKIARPDEKVANVSLECQTMIVPSSAVICAPLKPRGSWPHPLILKNFKSNSFSTGSRAHRYEKVASFAHMPKGNRVGNLSKRKVPFDFQF